jgi:hypothetical protein
LKFKIYYLKKIPPRFQNSSKGLEEMGYIPPAFLASEEFVGGIIPLKIPPTLKDSNLEEFYVWRKKIPPKNFSKTNPRTKY